MDKNENQIKVDVINSNTESPIVGTYKIVVQQYNKENGICTGDYGNPEVIAINSMQEFQIVVQSIGEWNSEQLEICSNIDHEYYYKKTLRKDN